MKMILVVINNRTHAEHARREVDVTKYGRWLEAECKTFDAKTLRITNRSVNGLRYHYHLEPLNSECDLSVVPV